MRSLQETLVQKTEINQIESITCGENLDRQIRDLESRLESLKEAKAEMQRVGLHDVKIELIRQAMRY